MYKSPCELSKGRLFQALGERLQFSHLIPAGAGIEADVVQLEVLHAERALQGLVVRRGWV